MVSQELVQKAMEDIGKPCTSRDILSKLQDNGYITGLKYNPTVEINNAISCLRKWEVVDVMPVGHMVGNNHIYYLKNTGYKHDGSNCDICAVREKNHNLRTRKLMTKLTRRKTSYKNRDDLESSPGNRLFEDEP